MFHLLVAGSGWDGAKDSMGRSRIFEFTDDALIDQFEPLGELNLELITRLPALFVSEINGPGDQLARVGTITRAKLAGGTVELDYFFEADIPPIPNSKLQKLGSQLSIRSFEFERTHWAVKDIDLFRVLLCNGATKSAAPKVFRVNPHLQDQRLMSVMMPFDSQFDKVYATLQAAGKAAELRCLRADDIWNDAIVIQDVVSLICESNIVVCDCTGRNANVFYEIGIAHTLGREVILITQNAADIPFDLRHLRFLPYLNNGEGREKLSASLLTRLQTLANSDS